MSRTATAPTAPELDQQTRSLLAELKRSYWMEIETVQNYLANATDLIGVRAEEIKRSLAGDIEEELGHARKLAQRIHVLGGRVPGSIDFKPQQDALQPPAEQADVVAVIHGVIEAETAAIDQYRKIIEMTEGQDYVTQDLCISLKADEEEHRRKFQGFLAEYHGC